jgi:hypothetical protein
MRQPLATIGWMVVLTGYSMLPLAKVDVLPREIAPTLILLRAHPSLWGERMKRTE